MKENVKKIFNLINKSEEILESAFLKEINDNDNFKKAYAFSEDSVVNKKLNLKFKLKKINNSYHTIISDDDKGESLKLLKLNNIGSATTNISPKGTFIKLKKSVINRLSNYFNNFRIT